MTFMGRIKRWAEQMQAKFPEGTFERIKRVSWRGEARTDFLRLAVEKEIRAREEARGIRPPES